MIIQCESCETKFRLDDAKVSSSGVKVRCTKCQNVFIVWPPERAEGRPHEEEAPEGAPAPSEEEVPEWEGVSPGQGAAPLPDEGAGEGGEEEAHVSGEETWAAGVEEEAGGKEEKEAGEQSAPPLSFGDIDLSFLKKDAEGEPEDRSGEAGDKSAEEERNEWKTALESELEEGAEEEDRDELLKALNEALVSSDAEEEVAGGAGGAERGEGAEGPGGAGAPELDFTLDEKHTGVEGGISPEDLGIFDGPDKRAEGAEGAGAEEGEGPLGEPLKKAGVVVSISAETKEVEEEGAEWAGGEEDLLSPEGAEEPPEDFKEVTAGELFQKEDQGEAETWIEDKAAAGPGFKAARPRTMGLGLVIVFLVIVAGGGFIYFSGIIDTLIGRVSEEAPSARTIAIQNIDGYVAENKGLGRVFVIEAKIRNIMSKPQEITGVRGTLYSSTGKKLADKTVAAGRVLSHDDISNLSEKDLLKPFTDASGGTLPPRGTVPIMVLFEKIPEGTAEFGIEVLR